MIDWMFAIFIMITFLFMYLAVEHHDDTFWGAMFTIIDIILWFFLSATVLEMETTYQIYNATTGNIETGIQIATSKIAPELVYMFYMFAAIMMVYFVGYFMFAPIYEVITGKKWSKRKE